jgi:hypothetical protein
VTGGRLHTKAGVLYRWNRLVLEKYGQLHASEVSKDCCMLQLRGRAAGLIHWFSALEGHMETRLPVVWKAKRRTECWFLWIFSKKWRPVLKMRRFPLKFYVVPNSAPFRSYIFELSVFYGLSSPTFHCFSNQWEFKACYLCQNFSGLVTECSTDGNISMIYSGTSLILNWESYHLWCVVWTQAALYEWCWRNSVPRV